MSYVWIMRGFFEKYHTNLNLWSGMIFTKFEGFTKTNRKWSKLSSTISKHILKIGENMIFFLILSFLFPVNKQKFVVTVLFAYFYSQCNMFLGGKNPSSSKEIEMKG